MITRLGIRGFKSLGFHGLDLPLAPITLILGENSIGKSSIFQALLALQQSWGKFAYIDQFSPVGQAVDLGRFYNLQHRFGNFVCRDTVVRIERGSGSLELRWHDPKASSVEGAQKEILDPPPGWPDGWANVGDSDLGQLRRIRLNDKFVFLPQWNHQTHSLSLTLDGASVDQWLEEHRDDPDALALSQRPVFTWDLDVASDSDFKLSIFPDAAPPENSSQDAFRELESRWRIGRQEGAPEPLWDSAYSALVQAGTFRRAVSELAHIGGLRERGKRIYEVVHSDRPWAVGPTGERIADILATSPAAADGSNLLLKLTNHLLGAARVSYTLDLVEPETLANIRELVLEEMNEGRIQGNRVGIPDVGTGISQLLPIAVQLAAFLEPGRFNSPILLIEQPETHLHPRLQANLAHMFARAISRKLPDGGSQIPQILVETHSEYLVLGLSLLIERKELEPSDVSLIKLTRDPETQEVVGRRVMVDGQGRFIDPWPEDFFPERDQLYMGKIPGE